ncbi:MAG: ABC transporter substrate-binding protein [Eubacteriales bacterium]|nr:ABC transporter substrate-binding protein [Eubacteriales bacterium]
MKWKRSLLLLWLAACVGLFSACGTQKAADTENTAKLLGFSQLGSESSWRLGNTESITRAAESHGISLMLKNANQRQENQIDAIRSFIAYQVDVISFSPIVEDGWDNVLTEAKNAGIPVILVDRLIHTEDDSLYDAYVGADFYQEGVRAGEYLVQKAERMKADKLCIVEIAGTQDSTPGLQRYQGFHDVVDQDSRLITLETVSGDFLRSKGKECMRSLLEKYGDQIDVLYSHNDGMTLGAIDVLEEQGLVPGKDIIIVTVDGEQEAIDGLKAGKINCVVECTPMLGDLVMELAEKLMAGEAVPKVTHPEEQVFTEFDDLSDLAPRGY